MPKYPSAAMGGLIVLLTAVGAGLLAHHFSRSCTYFPQAQAFTALGAGTLACAALLFLVWVRDLFAR